ncbi:MAG: pyridoxamine 5'-phosphate oxidase [Beijerinckiaceae bacterium]|nr:pyridoxamine 5'-phosphate oxidase [Beijerinckiaceae bacterium]
MKPLTSSDFTQNNNPLELFGSWFAEAEKAEPNDPSAMAVATVDADGQPDVRMVLMKEYDAQGFVFYTNSQSAKGEQLAGCMKAAANFHWKSLRRQVRLRGPVEIVPEIMSDTYFASRARDAKIGAWASQQSRPLESRFAFEKAIAAQALRYNIGDVPRPPHWFGYRIMPLQMEFWHDRPYRLHDRVTFTRAALDQRWSKERLYP